MKKKQTTCLMQLIGPNGPISYALSRKSVRNINLRVTGDGSVHVSAPYRMPLGKVEAFVQQKAEWIVQARQATLQRKSRMQPLMPPYEQIAEQLQPYCFKISALLHDRIDFFPEVIVKPLKSAWGICYPQKRKVTLNARLMQLDPELIEYVVLHEWIHFLHADHQAGFHTEMRRYMPDYAARRKRLRNYAC